MDTDFDVLVLGAGPGGYVAAIRSAQLGLRTAVVEGRFWGGVCLNIGCIPAKALLRNAEVAQLILHDAEKFGVKISGDVSLDYHSAYERSRTVADGRAKGVGYLMRKNRIAQFEGRGTFIDPHTMQVRLRDGEATLSFRSCIIATGATVKLLPGTTLGKRVVTFEEQILSDSLPSSLIIAGAGAIGVEFAYLLRSYGVEVTLVEFLGRIAPLEDEEVSAELTKRFKRQGIRVMTSARVESIEEAADSVRTVVRQGDEPQVLEAERVLQATGFQPRTAGYGLASAGVRLTDRGAIDVDGHCRTSQPHIYAIGDVTAKLMLAHAAEAMGVIAAESIAGVETMELDYRMVPRATFCQPQIASFGWTESEARAEGFDVRVAKFPFTANAKAHGFGDTVGFVKLVSDARYGELLGAHLIGPDVTELLPELTLAQKWDLTVTELIRNVHAHPTLSEAVQDALHGLAGHMINL
ncbi:dihydrolipoyl dehydrogenase [Streptomyces sp. RLB3-17]|uniref:Dihydrolipoyl dehydrogenase n=1 Tax=Streptomyces mirabilis TaxID=68239 RepID=A0ABU3V324_9ACTN|nr:MULTISPECIES: dihydrolipoyl dehydrogenase [Streptomyces]MDU9000585.1 dihydrolipoyl dehydrogenase [Streptomyces mirabilis]QDN95422.1 dihydrolipoyl dehydrogenase [Streptomyces sp. RLB1-9]QDO05713.1 dihydrolipoyl dehydrogenase [Streptomyces sp. S1D4-23]QDO17144.1 dihydrolipoyl dehydrogenase [Streptomyces sp. S1A1-8]QDO27267.1 dihydrolipoyl dehydrogenase [Streptomyces sp. S1A1-3]